MIYYFKLRFRQWLRRSKKKEPEYFNFHQLLITLLALMPTSASHFSKGYIREAICKLLSECILVMSTRAHSQIYAQILSTENLG